MIEGRLGACQPQDRPRHLFTLDAALITTADAISGYVEGMLDGVEFKRTSYALDRGARKATLAQFLEK